MPNEAMGLIGHKVGMTQFFRDNGEVVPVTVIQCGPCTVLQVKSEDGPDGYNAIQIAFGNQKEQRLNKPQKGHYAKAGGGNHRHVREIRLPKDQAASYKVGQVIKVSEVFEVGKRVDVAGTSKGRGMAGVMKRHNMAGFIRTHGTHEFFRHGGSIGTRLTPGHVFKGKKMPGHMGAERVSVQNLAVERIDDERDCIMVRGGVPGPPGGLIFVRHTTKT